VAAAVGCALAARPLATRLLCRLLGARSRAAARVVRVHLGGPLRLLAAALVVRIGLGVADIGDRVVHPIVHALTLVVIAAVGWLAVGLVAAGADLLADRMDIGTADNLRARRARTQAVIARRVSAVVIVVVTGAAMLMTFSQVRALGASLLASAGILGLVVGIAAQQTLANLLAGIQIALTEPIRLDDVVVVEDEWGRIEEITFTYVVVALWDERRLVLPISYFTRTPFQNWTRERAQILGAVSIHADYRVSVGRLRAELERVVRESDLWDGRVVVLQAVEAHEQTLELRALVSAADAGRAWNLRCLVRERLVAHLAERHPEALPRVRTSGEERAAAAGAAGRG
jgi:small-conductance mechanosensitive channel